MSEGETTKEPMINSQVQEENPEVSSTEGNIESEVEMTSDYEEEDAIDSEEDEESLSMADLLQQSDEQAKKFRRNRLVEGTVESIRDSEIYVSFTAVKYNGIISGEEVKEIIDKIKVGDPIKAVVYHVDEKNSVCRLSINKAKVHNSWQEIQNAKKKNIPLKGKVTTLGKKGYEIDVLGLRAFLPLSQAGHISKEGEELIGKEISLKIIEFDRRSKNIVVSHKMIIQEKAVERFQEIREQHKVGDNIKGTVTKIMSYGAFVDLDGFEGLVHRKDLSWSMVHDPKNHIDVGQEKEFTILSIAEDTQRIGLGLKQLKHDPWANIANRFHVDQVVDGHVRNLTSFGAFVELEEGIEGLVHVSDMSWKDYVKKPSEILEVGQAVKVKIMALEAEQRKLSLSIKHTQKEPWDEAMDNLYPGLEVKGIVKNITHFGAFVEIQSGVEGLLHISDLSWSHKIAKPEDILTKGENIDVKILSIEKKNRRISLGLKQMQEDPWDKVTTQYPKDSVVEGKVTKILNYGAFVELEEGVEGLVHISELSWTETVEDASTYLEIGETRKFKVLEIDKKKKKISLGLKQLEDNPWEDYSEKYVRYQDYEGVVTRIEKHGVYVELEEGLVGLVPKAHLAEEQVHDPHTVSALKDKVKVRVLELDKNSRRLKLSFKDAGKATPKDLEDVEKLVGSDGDTETIGDMISGSDLLKLKALMEMDS